jgi:hypothetical protein
VQHRGSTRFRRHRRRAPNFVATVATAVAALGLAGIAAPAARADTPVRGLALRALKPAPAEADALRFSVYGDGSNALLQVRLLTLGKNIEAADAGNYYQALPGIRVDFKGWKTFTVPLDAMRFFAEQAPGASGPSAGAFERRSADHVQFALTTTSAKVFLDDLAWAKSGDDGATVLVIDDFEAAGSAISFRAVGTYEQVGATTLALNRTAPFVRTGRGALQMVVRSRAVRERQQYAPTLMARLKRQPQDGYPYVMYARPPFEPIVPESTPTPAELSAIPGAPPQIRIFACADEIEPATFAVFAGRDLKNATVTIATDFVAEGAANLRFPRTAMNVHVVKTWEQAGLDPFVTPGDAPVTVPECLVKDDRTPLAGPLPEVRLAGDVITDIPAGASKQFWVTVRVPRGQRAGTYRARLLFSAPGVKPTAVPIVVDVLPVRLRSAFLQYGIDLRVRLNGGDAPQTAALPGDLPRVAPDRYAQMLANIRDHGFRWVSLYDKPGDLADPLRLYKEAGLSAVGPVVVMSGLRDADDARALERAKDGAALRDLRLYVGTPVLSQEEAATLLTSFAQAGGNYPKAAPVVGAGVLGDPLAPIVDVPIYSIGADYPQRLIQTGKRESNKRDWWTWNLGQENAPLNRLYTGFLLYRTGLNSSPLFGAFAGPFQYAPPGTDPFNEAALVARVAGAGTGGNNGARRPRYAGTQAAPPAAAAAANTATPASSAVAAAQEASAAAAPRKRQPRHKLRPPTPNQRQRPLPTRLRCARSWLPIRCVRPPRYAAMGSGARRRGRRALHHHSQGLFAPAQGSEGGHGADQRGRGVSEKRGWAPRPLTRLQPGEIQAIRKGIARSLRASARFVARGEPEQHGGLNRVNTAR